MIPENPTVNQLQNFLRTQQGVIEAVRISPDQLLLSVGERVQATVTGQLPNGRFSVLIKDQLLDLNLPRNTQPGEQLQLTVASKEPRLVFLMSSQAQVATESGVALSQAGKQLTELLSGKNTPASATLQQAIPLFEGEPVPAQLAGQLATRLAESGLFYESHQAEWANGQRPLHQLLREPQAQLPLDTKLQTATASQNALPAQANAVADSQNQIQVGQFQDSDPLKSTTAQAAATHMVQQQLAVLEDKPLVWLGQAWPGQPLRWETELENERDPAQPLADPERVWQTQLALTLPKLGELGVTATLRNNQFQLRFAAENPQTQALLQQNLDLLAQHFQAAGLQLATAQVVPANDEET